MAYPAGVTQATITVGGSIDWFGEQVQSLRADVTPVIGGGADHLVHRETGVTMVVASRSFSDNGTGFLSFQIPHVDQRGWFDGSGRETTMWAYSVQVSVGLQDGSRKKWRKTVQPLVGQESIDLDLVQDGQVTAPVAAPVPVVTSVNGQTGAVVIDGGSGAVDLDGYATSDELASGLSEKVDMSTFEAALTQKADKSSIHEPYDDTALVERVTALEERPVGEGGGVDVSALTVELVEDPDTPGALKYQVVSA